jgi:hypothetical protein
VVQYSYNGWPASPDPTAIGIDPDFAVAGLPFPGGVKSGPVAVVLGYVATEWHRRVEPLVEGYCWGYEYRANSNNPSQLSCHASGTALDLNAPIHPNGVAGTMASSGARRTVRAILEEVGGVVQWGGDFTGIPDEMHLEICGTPEEVALVAQEIGTEEDVLSPQDIEAVAAAVMDKLQHQAVVKTLTVDSKTGMETGHTVSVTRALQSAQTSSARTLYTVRSPEPT